MTTVANTTAVLGRRTHYVVGCRTLRAAGSLSARNVYPITLCGSERWHRRSVHFSDGPSVATVDCPRCVRRQPVTVDAAMVSLNLATMHGAPIDDRDLDLAPTVLPRAPWPLPEPRGYVPAPPASEMT